MEEGFDGLFSLSNLMCEEDGVCLNENFDDGVERFCSVFGNVDDDYVEILLEKERKVFGSKSVDFSDDCGVKYSNWLKCARLDAIDWIFNTRASFGLRIQTGYLSVDYFDQFLSKRFIEDGKLWAIRLLAVACLSLAAKMEECKVPALSEFRVKDFDFESKVIMRMELLLLDTLGWKLDSITPFHFLHYHINKLCSSRPRELISKAVDFLMNAAKGMNLMDTRPSILSLAAALAATDAHLSKQSMELKLDVIPSKGSLDIERIYYCYNLVQGVEIGKISTPKSDVSPNLSSTCLLDVLGISSSLTPGAGAKRRLTYNGSDHSSKRMR